MTGTADLEVAIRAWANQDPQAAEMQERVYARRVGYLRELLAGQCRSLDA